MLRDRTFASRTGSSEHAQVKCYENSSQISTYSCQQAKQQPTLLSNLNRIPYLAQTLYPPEMYGISTLWNGEESIIPTMPQLYCRLFEVNEKGSVPVVKDLQAEKWYTDSAEFVDFLEEKYPKPKLGKTDTVPDV